MFLCYPNCTTCQKARAYLDEKKAAYEFRDIKQNPPSVEELRVWHKKSALPLKRFFNTSGLVYKKLALAKKLPQLGEEAQYALLASDGMLVKRPILVLETRVLVGFRQAEWDAAL